jgi:Family of unknown function (DUF5320)
MPGGDRTGPLGMGPMSGRAAGFCARYAVPGYMNPALGRGGWPFGGWGGPGGGRGRGFRNRFYATGLTGRQRAGRGGPGVYAPDAPFAPPEISPEQELSALRNELTYMEDALKRTQERIAELEKEGKAQ